MEEIITVPSQAAGVEPPLTEIQTPAQAVTEPQPTDTVVVENGNNQPQVTDPQRKKPSDFYREREKFRRLEETQRLTQQRLDEIAEFLKPKPENQSDQPFNKDQFFLDPENFLKSREQKLRDEISKLNQ